MRLPLVSIIIVVYKNEWLAERVIRELLLSSYNEFEVIVVDNYSDGKWVDNIDVPRHTLKLLVAEKNLGFCGGNNLALNHISPDSKYILFLNPDLFVKIDTLALVVDKLEICEPSVSALTAKLYWFDLEKNQKTAIIDSVGLSYTWYGRYYDRGQGEYDNGDYDSEEFISAMCGAFIFIRRKALEQVVSANGEFFPENYFAYKEDIFISLYLKKLGYSLLYFPGAVVYHCRGWNKQRINVPYFLKVLSLKNEWRLLLSGLLPKKIILQSFFYFSLKTVYVFIEKYTGKK